MRDIVQITGNDPSGVSGILPTAQRSFEMVVMQQGKRPLDLELNLLQQILHENAQLALKRIVGSGITIPLAVIPAGTINRVWLVAETESLTPAIMDGRCFEIGDPDNDNLIIGVLTSPPPSGTRTDFMFLECWYEEVQPNVGTINVSTSIYKNGGVANATLTNDLAIGGQEYARRIQARWRIRAVENINKVTYPLGLNAPTVKAQGGANSVSTLSFTQDPSDPNLFVAGAGDIPDATTLKAVDGYSYAIPLCFIERAAGEGNLDENRVTLVAPLISIRNADRVNGFHVSGNASPNTLLPLDNNAKFPNSVLNTGSGKGFDADSVDTRHAIAASSYDNVTPANNANKLLALDLSGKIPNAAIAQGTGSLLDADTVDTFHAIAAISYDSGTPANNANKLLALDANGKFINAAIAQGSSSGLDADSVDSRQAIISSAYNNTNPIANAGKLLALDGNGKIILPAIPQGAGSTLNGDTINGLNAIAATAYDNVTPANNANKLVALDATGRLPLLSIPQGPSSGLNGDTLDNLQATAFAPASHSHRLGTNTQFATGIINISVAAGATQTIYSTNFNFATAGMQMVTWSVEARSSSAAGQFTAQIYINGSPVANSFQIKETGNPGWRIALYAFNFSAGSTPVQLVVTNNTVGTTVTVQAATLGYFDAVAV